MSGKVEPTLPTLAIGNEKLDSPGTDVREKVEDLQQPERASLSSPDNNEENPPATFPAGKKSNGTTERLSINLLQEKGSLVPNRHMSTSLDPEDFTIFNALGNAVDAEDVAGEAKYVTGWRKNVKKFMGTLPFNIVVIIFTLYAVLGLSIAEAAEGSNDYVGLWVCSILTFIFFSLELIFVALVDPREMKRFYYVLDAIGTLSLLPDIIKSWNMSGVTIARAARVARAGTRSVRMVRIFRIMRMVRVVRVFKLMKFVNKASGKLANSTLDGGGGEGDAAERGSVARKHAEIVESRVVIGVILLILSLSNLTYESVDNSAFSGLEILAQTFQTGGRSAWYSAGEVYSEQIDSLVYLGFGNPDTEACNRIDSTKIRQRIKYCLYNVTVTDYIDSVAIKYNIYEMPSSDNEVIARFDLTTEVKERAVYDILLTLFLMVLFTTGSFVFNRDAVKHIVQPLSRMSNQISHMAVTIFGMPESHVVNANSKVLEAVLENVARMFHTDNLKITTLYTSSQFASEVWTVSVGKEKEESRRSGGTSHRMDLNSINTLQGQSHTPSKRKQIRNFRFGDFMNDPMALKHFGSFLEEKNPDMHNALQFWEDARRYKKTMSNNVVQAERLARTYVDEADTSLNCLSDIDKDEVRQKVFWNPPTIESFDATIRRVEDVLRDECFEAFIEDLEAFEHFKKSKTELDKCILFENEYAKPSKQEEPQYLKHRLKHVQSV